MMRPASPVPGVLLLMVLTAFAGCVGDTSGPDPDRDGFTATYASEEGTLEVWAHPGHQAMAANGSVVEALLVGFEAPRFSVRFLTTPELVPIQRVTDCAPRVEQGCLYRSVEWYLEDQVLPLALGVRSGDVATDDQGPSPLEFSSWGTLQIVHDPHLPVPVRFNDGWGRTWERTDFQTGPPSHAYARPTTSEALTSHHFPTADRTFIWPFPGADEALPGRNHSILDALETYLEEADHGFEAPYATICVDQASGDLRRDRFTLDLSQGTMKNLEAKLEWRAPTLLEEGGWEIEEYPGRPMDPCAHTGPRPSDGRGMTFGSAMATLLPIAEGLGDPSAAGFTRDGDGSRIGEPLYHLSITPAWAEAGSSTSMQYRLEITPDGHWSYAHVDPTKGLYSTAASW